MAEDSVKAIKMLTEMRRQDKSLPGIHVTVVQISIDSTLKTTTYMELAVVVMVVEQPKNIELKLPLTDGGKADNFTYQRLQKTCQTWARR